MLFGEESALQVIIVIPEHILQMMLLTLNGIMMDVQMQIMN